MDNQIISNLLAFNLFPWTYRCAWWNFSVYTIKEIYENPSDSVALFKRKDFSVKCVIHNEKIEMELFFVL